MAQSFLLLRRVGQIVLPALSVGLLVWEYLRTIYPLALGGGGVALVFPPMRFNFEHWETWVGGLLLLLSGVAGGAQRFVMWKNQSVLIPSWKEKVDNRRQPDVRSSRYVCEQAFSEA